MNLPHPHHRCDLDQRKLTAVNLLHRALQYRGVAPFVGFFIERNRANMPINAWRNQGATIGFSKTF